MGSRVSTRRPTSQQILYLPRGFNNHPSKSWAKLLRSLSYSDALTARIGIRPSILSGVISSDCSLECSSFLISWADVLPSIMGILEHASQYTLEADKAFKTHWMSIKTQSMSRSSRRNVTASWPLVTGMAICLSIFSLFCRICELIGSSSTTRIRRFLSPLVFPASFSDNCEGS